jgi:hypothetical protein
VQQPQEQRGGCLQAAHDIQTVIEHRVNKQKSDKKKAGKLKARNKCGPIFLISNFMDPAILKDVHLPHINLQLKW